jgi:localization factor PodJL
MHNLGVYLFRGEGGAQDLAGAAQWFRKAAAAGVVESQYNLGLLYQSGSGVEQDASQARYWFRLAAARGDADARRALADLKVPAQTAQR